MASHSSVPAWRIPWTLELGGLQSMKSQRERHDCATNIFTRFHALAGRFFTTEPPGKCGVRIFKQADDHPSNMPSCHLEKRENVSQS